MFSLCLVRWHAVSVCPVSDDVHFDHFVKVTSTKLLCKVFFSLLVINNFCGEVF